MGPNIYLLAADNSPLLLPLLRQKPELAHSQDDHGYSLLHAAASYNYLDLLRSLVLEFKVDVNIRDEDDETPLFVTETVTVAMLLVEELGANADLKGLEGLTAREKIEAEGDFPEVASYLKNKERLVNGTAQPPVAGCPPSQTEFGNPPEGIEITVGTLNAEDDIPSEADPEFRRRIEELAQRDDFGTPRGQAELRQLIEDAIVNQESSSSKSAKFK